MAKRQHPECFHRRIFAKVIYLPSVVEEWGLKKERKIKGKPGNGSLEFGSKPQIETIY